MITFVESIKEVLNDIQITGGARIEHNSVSPTLVQSLREYAVTQFSIHVSQSRHAKYVWEEWFNEGLFSNYVHACVTYLAKLGILDEERVYISICRLIDMVVSGDYTYINEAGTFEEILTALLVEVWEQVGDAQTSIYTLARERWLITWDYLKSQWKITGLGRLFLELSPIQAVTLLLSIDILFCSDENDYRHISMNTLRATFGRQNCDWRGKSLIPPHRGLLFRLGIIQGFGDDEGGRPKLTPLGRTVISRVLSKDNPLYDAAKSLIESEQLGNSFKGSITEAEEIREIAKHSELVKDANQKSIETSVSLFKSGSYLDSLRVVYPSIEAVVNEMLVKERERPENFNGLVKKVNWLQQQGIVPADVSSAVEVFTGRNKILHGNFAPPDDYVFPLCLLAFRYLRRLLTEYKSPLKGM